jgi:hypothetical protein
MWAALLLLVPFAALAGDARDAPGPAADGVAAVDEIRVRASRVEAPVVAGGSS